MSATSILSIYHPGDKRRVFSERGFRISVIEEEDYDLTYNHKSHCEGLATDNELKSKILEMTQVSETDEGIMTAQLPILFSRQKTGSVIYWEVSTLGNEVIIKRGFLEGAEMTAARKAVGKNKGSSNETSSDDQAVREAQSKWIKKIKKAYSLEIPAEQGEEPSVGSNTREDLRSGNKLFPMACHKYSDHKHRLKFPCFISEKLDGIRCAAFLQDIIDEKSLDESKEGFCHLERRIYLTSRTYEPFYFLDHIRRSLLMIYESLDDDEMIKVENNAEIKLSKLLRTRSRDLIFDGELYTHGMPFQEITSISRKKKTPHSNEKGLCYYIFDIISTNLEFELRNRVLTALSERFKNFTYIKFVKVKRLTSEKEIMSNYHDYMAQKYEGIILRNAKGKYELSSRQVRSYDVLKYKEFEDKEFQIVDANMAQGTEEGSVLWVCTAKATSPVVDATFQVRMRGELDYKKKLYLSRKKYFGKMLTVRFQGLTDDGIPRFPVGIEIRDYE
jgi:DNA ligase-1